VKKNLTNMTLKELERFITEIGEQKFRARQIYKWINSGAESFEEMTDLSKGLRQKLEEVAVVRSLKLAKVQESATDYTKKFLFELEDGNTIETVFMKYKHGNSLCISSQAGCRMGCTFCASGIGGLKRNLTGGEMMEQVLSVSRSTGERISHIVVMGTGEPFDNYLNLTQFLELIHEPEGLHISYRNITVSTCGIVPMISRFAHDFPQVNLAVSLHAPEDALRSRTMPINRSYPLDQLVKACRDYGQKTGRRITFEYALVKGVNDSLSHADRLSDLLRGILCHVNLIPLNPVREAGMQGTDRETAERFRARLEKRGIPATIRRELGTDIAAACGQLRLG
jgi:23S rRNA (adenine2503-C2)-methyltransferase